jgi:superfamily II DNA or RNA helicase
MTKENQILIELLDNVSKWSDLKKKLEQFNTKKTETTTKKTFAGKIFEYFCKYYFQTSPEKIDLYKNVWHYEEIPLNVRKELNLPSIDHGIDILLKDIDNNYHAVQCKFKNDESKSLSWSGDKIANVFALGTNCQKIIVFSNVADVTKVAKAFGEKYEQILNDTLLDLDKNDFKRILALAKGNQPPSLEKYSPRKHQKIAIDKVDSHFKLENRGQLILPCGAGKTLTALWIKEKLKAKITLVLVPSLALLRQIKNDWAKHKNSFYRPLYVCSEKDIDKGEDSTVTHSYEIGGPVTTDYIKVQTFLKLDGDKIIFSTYQSIEVVSNASKSINGFEFDLIICDEAHRTAGSAKKNTFTIVHDNNKLSAVKRLYMTATPKVVSTRLKAKLGDEYELLCDMSNPSIFGEEAFRMSFGEAIDKGILVDYQIIGIGVTDKEVKKYIEEREFIEHITAKDLADNFALELAMNKYRAFHGLTFHSKVDSAKAFSKRHSTFFENVYSESVNGKQSTTFRKKVLDEFKNSPKGIVSNARCLTEGVDVPSIDLIYFCDPKTSKIDIVQASGRALRKDPNGKKKRGYIVIPIFHHIEENLEEEIKKKPIFNYLIQVVRAMCDQDERLEAEINNIASKKGKRSNSKLLIDFKDNEIEKIIRLEGLEKKLQSVLFDEIIEKTKDVWQLMFMELLDFHKEHNHLEVSKKDNQQLGNWIYEQRRKNRAKKLNFAKRNKLDSIGFDWRNEEFREETDFDEIWWSSYQKLIKYHKENGDCDIPARYSKDKPLGTWVIAQRAKNKKNELAQSRIDLLDELDFSWDARVKIFEQFCLRLIEFKDKYGHTEVPALSKDFPKLGKWTNKYRSIFNNGTTNENGSITYSGSTLKKAQIEKVFSLGFKKTFRKINWDESFLELKEYFLEHGNSQPTQSENSYLYYWCYRVRKNKETLTAHQRELLDSVNFDINIKFKHKYSRTGSNQNWIERFLELQICYEENQHFNITQENEEFEGLYNWIIYQRKESSKGALSKDKEEKLKSIGLDFNIHFLTKYELDWGNRFSELEAYYSKHNTFYIATSDIENKSLLLWLRYQRLLFKNDNLDEFKKSTFLSIGYSFTHKYTGGSTSKENDIWLRKLEELKSYFEKTETFLIPKTDKDYNHLIPWIQYQKKLNRENKLSPFKESKLLSIGFSFDIDYRGKTISSLSEISEFKSDSSNLIWETKLKELVNFHSEFNTFRIPSGDKSLQPLKSWLQYQKQLFKKGILENEKTLKFKNIGYSFDLDYRGQKQKIALSDDLVWLERFEELKFYKTEYNTFLIAKDFPQYDHLKKWLTEQKRLFKSNTLPKEKIDKLNELGYSFNLNYQGKKFTYEVNPSLKEERSQKKNSRQTTWESTYLELLNFKVKYGHCQVLRSFEDKTLANFVSRQRFLFKKGNLEPDKIEKLQILGFEFETKTSSSWESKYSELKEFFDKNGHSNYKKKDGNPSIYNWILGQRVYKRKGTLDKTRISKLNEIKFIWEANSKGSSPREDEWFDKLLEFKAYKVQFGNANVSQLDSVYKSLGRWLNDQRVTKKGRKNHKGEIIFLSKERESLLNDVGVVWDMKEYEWNNKLELLNSFHKENGHFNVKQKEKGYLGLYYWIFNIKKSGTSVEKRTKLKNIGFDTSLIRTLENE